jgi:hypothetical protein
MTDFDLLDTELPPPVVCVPEKKIRTAAGTIVSFEEIVEGGGGGGGGGDLPQHQEWTELSRVTTEIILPEDQCECFSVVIQRVDVITFGMGDKTLKLNLTGW